LGTHDVRLVNKWGVSNPRAFVVGDLTEVLEKEPNNDVPQAQRVELDSTISGAMANPTDVDYFVFSGRADQRVVICCLASSIDSRLRAGLELFDSRGRQLAFNRGYHGTDALVDSTLPEDGDYYIRLYEFTHTQGNNEHFYRLSLSTAPWIDAIIPPMVEPGKPARLKVYGRNLPGGHVDPSAVVEGQVLEQAEVTLDAPADAAAAQKLQFSGRVASMASALDGFEYRMRNAAGSSNPYLLTFARAPVVLDNEANDTPASAQAVVVPCEIAGRIEKRRDRDWYSFTAKKGEVYVLEVLSDRLGSQTDMYCLLRNPATKQDLADLDDSAETLTPVKFYTRTDDPPRFRFAVPADGLYQLLVASRDADSHASPRHIYRVRITPEEPDFRLIVLPPDTTRPDSCVLRQGGQQNYDVLVWRLDGWNGEITLTAEGLPKGITCSPQQLGQGLRQASLVLTASADAPAWTGEIKIKGTATIAGRTVTREARPASITWPVQPQQNIPAISRLDRSLVLAVRDQAPYSLTTSLDKAMILQGDKANLTLNLARLWPDFKTPLQVQAVVAELPPNLVVNNNQPFNLTPGKDTATLEVNARSNVVPGTYNLVLRTQAQIPYNKDPMAKQKPNLNVVQPSTQVTLTVLPRQVASVSVGNANPAIKVGTEAEVVIRVNRMYDYAGPFLVELVFPPNIKGISADEVAIPSGKTEAKLIVKVAADAAPGNRPNLTVRATAQLRGSVITAQEARFSLNVVK
jgi:hypothetical protein